MSDFERLLNGLADGTIDVEIDNPRPMTSPHPTVATDHARTLAAAIAKGDRVAYVFIKALQPREDAPGHNEELGINEEEARQLIDAGARRR